MMMPEEVRKIAVLRANGLGDFLFALPALESLRAAFPQAEIVLLGLPWHVSFLEGRQSPVDRVVVVPPAKGIREEAGLSQNEGVLSAFFAAMEEERFDIAFQMHGGGRYSNPFVTRLKARFSVGLRAPDAPPLDLWVPYVYFQPEILRYLEVARLAGAQAVTHEPALAVTEADISEYDVRSRRRGRSNRRHSAGRGRRPQALAAGEACSSGRLACRPGLADRHSRRSVREKNNRRCCRTHDAYAGATLRPPLAQGIDGPAVALRARRRERQRPSAFGARSRDADRRHLLVRERLYCRPGDKGAPPSRALLAARMSGLRGQLHQREMRPP